MCERLTPETPTSLQALLCCCKRLWDSGVRAQRAMWYLSLTRLNTQVHHLSTKEIGAALAAITVHNAVNEIRKLMAERRPTTQS